MHQSPQVKCHIRHIKRISKDPLMCPEGINNVRTHGTAAVWNLQVKKWNHLRTSKEKENLWMWTMNQFQFSLFMSFKFEVHLIVISLPCNDGTLHHVLLFSPACSTRGISITSPHDWTALDNFSLPFMNFLYVWIRCDQCDGISAGDKI